MVDTPGKQTDEQQFRDDSQTNPFRFSSERKTRIENSEVHQLKSFSKVDKQQPQYDQKSQKNKKFDEEFKEELIDDAHAISRSQKSQSIGSSSSKLSEKKESKKWIIFAFSATICFTACNTAISEVTSRSGPLCILYFSLGSLISGATYNYMHCFKNWRTGRKFWLDQNIIVDGRFRCVNFVGFLLFCLLYFMIQSMAFLTIWFANLAQVNVGMITVIWSINPLYMAAADYFIFRQQLKIFHLIGTVLIVGCTVLLSLKPMIVGEELGSNKLPEPNEAPKIVKDGELLPMWMPVLFGILTPVTFCLNNILIRYLTSEEKGIKFNGSTLSMSGIFSVNLIILIFAIVYWQDHHFSHDLFWVGLAGSIINTIGLTCINTACALGPLGPVASINALANILLVIVEAVKHLKVPNYIEFISLVLGFTGALVLVIPDQIG